MLKNSLLVLGLLNCASAMSMDPDNNVTTNQSTESKNAEENVKDENVKNEELGVMLDQLFTPGDVTSSFTREEVLTSAEQLALFFQDVMVRIENNSIGSTMRSIDDFKYLIKKELTKSFVKHYFEFPYCVEQIVEYAFERTYDKILREESYAIDWDVIYQGVIDHCNEFVMMSGYSIPSDDSVALFTQEQLNKTMDELSLSLAKYEQEVLRNPKYSQEPCDSFEALTDLFDLLDTVRDALDVTTNQYSHPELVKELDKFVQTLESYGNKFFGEETDFKGILALLMHERKTFFPRLTYAAPLLEKLIPLLVRTVIIPQVNDYLFGTSNCSCEKVSAIQERGSPYNQFMAKVRQADWIRSFPLHTFFNLLKLFPLEALVKIIGSQEFKDQSRNPLAACSSFELRKYSFALPLVPCLIASLSNENVLKTLDSLSNLDKNKRDAVTNRTAFSF